VQYRVDVYRTGRDGQSGKSEGVKVVSHQDLGPHHVTVVEIQDVNAFEAWITDFFRAKDLGQPVVTDKLRKTVADYCSRAFRFLAVDVIDVPQGRKTVAPVAYRFKCDHVYYPLRVTNLYGGEGTVELFCVLNPWRDGRGAEWPRAYALASRKEGDKQHRWICSREITLSTDELTTLHPVSKDLFRDSGASFYAAKFEGQLQFDDDIWLSMEYRSPRSLCMRFLALLQEHDTDAVEFLVQTPFGLDRKKVYTDKSELIAALNKISQDESIRQFKIQRDAFVTAVPWRPENEFDSQFIESQLKGKKWDYYKFASDTASASFHRRERHVGMPTCPVSRRCAARVLNRSWPADSWLRSLDDFASRVED